MFSVAKMDDGRLSGSSVGRTSSSRNSVHSNLSSILEDEDVIAHKLLFPIIGAGASSLVAQLIETALREYPQYNRQDTTELRVLSKASNGSQVSRAPTRSCRIPIDATKLAQADEKSGHVAKLRLQPVAFFGDAVLAISGFSEWRTYCAIFLLDLREEDHREVFSDLDRRLAEVSLQVNSYLTKAGLHTVPPLLVTVLQHQEPDTFPGDNVEATELTDINLRLDNGTAPGDCTVTAFIDRIRKKIPSNPALPLHYSCNFDDSLALVQIFRSLASTLIDLRASEDNDVAIKAPDSSKQQRHLFKPSCRCCIM